MNMQMSEFCGHTAELDRQRSLWQPDSQRQENRGPQFDAARGCFVISPLAMRPALHRPFLIMALLSGCLPACNKPDPKDLPEWSPADHDNQTNASTPGAAQSGKPAANRPAMPNLEKYGITELALATWKQSCVPCHGVIGRGDGPQGAAVRPRDLTDPKWQRVAIDSEIEHAIKKGRGRMPAFADLPDETVTGLVRLIRLLNADPNAKREPEKAQPQESGKGTPAAQPQAAPPSTAAPKAADAPPSPAPAGPTPPSNP